MNKDLQNKSEELERSLAKQLDVFKKGSEDWLKVGAAVAVGAVLVYGVVQLAKKKQANQTDKAMQVLEKEGLLTPEIKERLTQKKSASLWSGLLEKILFVGIGLAKDKIMEQFASNSPQAVSPEREEK